MEAQLDEIAAGQLAQQDCLNQFYFGERGLQQSINELMENIDAREVPGIPLGESDGALVQIKVGQYGAYVSNGETNADLPQDSTIDSVTLDLALELIEQRIAGPQLLGVDSETDDNIYLANGRYGYYVQRGEPREVPKARGKGTKDNPAKTLFVIGWNAARRNGPGNCTALAYASERTWRAHRRRSDREDCCCKWPIWPLCFLGWYLC